MKTQIKCVIPASTLMYTIDIWSNSLNESSTLSKVLSLDRRFAIVTDDTVFSLHAETIFQSLLASGFEGICLSIPSGETSKTRATLEYLENQLFEKGFGKDICIIAIGGGVVTDIAGYLASIYCRGVPIIMIPTTLLGMVDASIGGKNGVNVPWGKNLLGCIYQPRKILIDPTVLSTLPTDELKNGIVEMIKHALISDGTAIDVFENHAHQILSKDTSIIENVIFESCRIKKTIIEDDERENGKRHLLNFGHTIGHALENLTQYALPHGKAVAIGILVESYMSTILGMLSFESLDRIQTLFKTYGISFALPSLFSYEEIINAMALDKKSSRGTPRFVLLESIGKPHEGNCSYCTQVDEKVIRKAIQWMNDDLCHH